MTEWYGSGEHFTQLAAIGNYLVGPLFLLPLVYYRLQEEADTELVLVIFVMSLVVPTLLFMFVARVFGTPVVDISAFDFDYLLNVSVYHLGNIDFQLTRTQSGIPLAVLISASFALMACSVKKNIRLAAVLAMVAGLFLLLVTGSVGSSLAALCGIVLILFISRSYFSVTRYAVFLPLLLVLVLIGWSQVPPAIKKYAESRYEEKLAGGVNVSDRSGQWHAASDYLLDNPLGRGWKLFVPPIGGYPHNDYLSYGIAFGIACGLLYLFVPAKILHSLVSRRLEPRNIAQISISLAGVGAVAVLLINSMSDHLTANRWYFNVVWSVIWFGYFVNRSRFRV